MSGYATAPKGTARLNLKFWAARYLVIRYPNGPDLYPDAADKNVDEALDAFAAEVRAEERKRLAAEMREVEAGRQKQATPLTGDLYAEGLRSGWEFAVQHVESSNG